MMTKDQISPLVLALQDAGATLEQVGGKGASLARMAAAGLPVPPGFYITTAAYRRFVAQHGLQAQILAAVVDVAADQPAALETASRQIAGLFAQCAMPDDIAEAIRQAYAELGGGDLPVAVRSSATAEDLPGMSFAGQQETYLNIHGEAMLLDAVKRCWASLWTARAIGYRARQGIASQDVSLAVVVQELVPADAAGILFTANPLTGARDQLLINAAWGLGEAIVGGQVTPDTVVVDKASGAITEQQINAKDVMTVRSLDGTHEEPVPAERRTQAVLSPPQASELARIGVRIENLYGQPMDIEWALHDGQIFIVQARPITALPEGAAGSRATQAAVWELPNPKGRYMRSSALELLPDPLSPLFATLGLPAWAGAMAAFARSIAPGMLPDQMLTTINGYGYYDLTFTPAQTAKTLLAIPRFAMVVPHWMNTARSRWQAARSRYVAVVDRWQTINPATMSAKDLLGGVREITTQAAEYYLSIQSGILPAAYMSESLFTLVYNRFFKRRQDPAALTFMLGFNSAPIQAEKSLYDLAQSVREHPEQAAALANMSSEQFTTAYREQATQAAADRSWPEFWRHLADHLAHFGHTIYDLDFAKAVLADDPAPILETLKFFLSGQAPDPHKRQAAAEAAREQATQTMLARLRGLRLRIFRRLVRAAQGFAPLREDALADVGLGWPVLRRLLRELGQRLVASNVIDTPDDIFWLKWDELRAAAPPLDAHQHLGNYRALVAERRATWASQHAFTPPVALPLKDGARFLGINFSSVMPARTDQPAGDVLKGIAASPGRVTGPARVIQGPDEFAQMQPGDILVARITTPAWTPLFALAAGVVTDVGGPLSHSSIVAREYHIPAVLGTGVATERLGSGQRITVDGDTGTVTVSRDAQNGATEEWNDSLAGDYLWTSGNVGEAVPDVMTPCTWSLIQIFIADAMAVSNVDGHRLIGNIGGRFYMNLSVLATLAAAFGLSRKRFAEANGQAFGRLPDLLALPLIPVSRWRVLRDILPVALRMRRRVAANQKKQPAFIAMAQARCDALRAQIQAASSARELIDLWHADLLPFFHECSRMLEAGARRDGSAIVFVRSKLSKLVGEADASALLSGLSADASHLASLGPLVGLDQLARGEIDRATYARQYGHRGPHEFEVSIARPAEDPDWIDRQLAGLREAPLDVPTLLARQKDAQLAAWQRLQQCYPRQAAGIRRRIERATAAFRDREAARSEVIRVFWALRAFVQRAGVLTGQGDAIFFLSIDEILALLGGDLAPLANIPARRTAYARYRALPTYPSLIRGRFDPSVWAADPQRRSDVFDAYGYSAPVGDTISGFPGAAGVVEGRARVIATAEEGEQLQAGEILVTTVTNVGWTPLFPRAAAVVTDVGAPLSHAAIVARELGIPAVVGCGNATMRLHTGDLVRVNGEQGTVELLRAADAA